MPTDDNLATKILAGDFLVYFIFLWGGDYTYGCVADCPACTAKCLDIYVLTSDIQCHLN